MKHVLEKNNCGSYLIEYECTGKLVDASITAILDALRDHILQKELSKKEIASIERAAAVLLPPLKVSYECLKSISSLGIIII